MLPQLLLLGFEIVVAVAEGAEIFGEVVLLAGKNGQAVTLTRHSVNLGMQSLQFAFPLLDQLLLVAILLLGDGQPTNKFVKVTVPDLQLKVLLAIGEFQFLDDLLEMMHVAKQLLLFLAEVSQYGGGAHQRCFKLVDLSCQFLVLDEATA